MNVIDLIRNRIYYPLYYKCIVLCECDHGKHDILLWHKQLIPLQVCAPQNDGPPQNDMFYLN